MYRIDTLDLLRRTFGLVNATILKPYLVTDSDIQPQEDSFYNVREIEVTESIVRSALGTPIILPVKFLEGRWKEKDEKGNPVFIRFPEYDIPAATLLEINQAKVIQKTKIAGRNGTVKELISDDDFRVSFKGLIVNSESNDPPETGIRAFKEFVERPVAVNVQNDLFEWLGIFELVVENWSLFQLEGIQHVMAFTLSCLSDNPIEIKVRDGI